MVTILLAKSYNLSLSSVYMAVRCNSYMLAKQNLNDSDTGKCDYFLCTRLIIRFTCYHYQPYSIFNLQR
jgi:hypothetical protein